MRLLESETYKMMHDIGYLNLFKNKTRIMDLVDEKKLTEMWKKGMRWKYSKFAIKLVVIWWSRW